MIEVKIVQTAEAIGLPLPAYSTGGAAGMDLRTCHDFTLLPGARTVASTGLIIQIPPGFEGQVRPRSGIAKSHGIGMINSPGTIDCDYRGVVGIILVNHSRETFHAMRGDRVAQIVFAPVVTATLSVVDAESLSSSDRSAGGFGHTGTS